MTTLASQLNPRSADFQANAAAMQALVDDLNAQVALHAAGGGEIARQKHSARGKLPPRERVQMLLDPGRSWRSRPSRRTACTWPRTARWRRPAPASSPASAA